MPDWPERPFLIAADGLVALSYAGLARRLALPTYRPVLRPASPADALIAIVTALVHRTPLTLVDADFSPDELAKLGVAESDLHQEAPLPGEAPSCLSAARSAVLAAPGFSLTLFTSGSTGLPKRVTHRLETLVRTLRVSQERADDVWAMAYSSTHIAGAQVLLQAFANGNPLVDLLGLGRLDVQQRMRFRGVTHISATPTFYRLLLPLESPLTSVRGLTLGGERSDADLLDRLRAAFPAARLHNLYASTEAGTLFFSNGELFGIHPAVAGKVRITDGQLLVSRSLLAEFDGAAFSGEWYATGDRVEVVSENPLRFRILGRTGDFINVGGAKVDPTEVEDALRAFPSISEARVFGRANSVVGTLLCAEYTSPSTLPEPDIRAHLATRLQPHKVPRLIKRVDSLAKTRTGKLSRHA